ncbi:Epimerase domain-containing protein [Psidium guajava]|nr:Epimerase domain-containing protein [Psidium guajava]
MKKGGRIIATIVSPRLGLAKSISPVTARASLAVAGQALPLLGEVSLSCSPSSSSSSRISHLMKNRKKGGESIAVAMLPRSGLAKLTSPNNGEVSLLLLCVDSLLEKE